LTACTTSGWPLASASILLGPPMRVERPAAAPARHARACCGSGILAVAVVARLRPAGDLGQSPPAPCRTISARPTRRPGGQALQHHVEAVVLGRLGAARQNQHPALPVELGRSAAGCRDRPHAEMHDLARRLPRCRPAPHRGGRRSPRRRRSGRCRSPRS
jgi:hypothetical protein